MRIAIPLKEGRDNFQENVAVTLRSLGHEVITPSSVPWSRGNRLQRVASLALRMTFPQRWEAHERWVCALARDTHIDVVLCLTQCLRSEVLEDLLRSGVSIRIAWWGDAAANLPGVGLATEGWSAVFLKERAAVKKLECLGLPAFHLHEAMNPMWHKPIARPSTRDALAVAGNYYGYRQSLVCALMDAGIDLDLYGSRPPRWALPQIKQHFSGEFIVKERKAEVFRGALACLNSTSMVEGDGLNCRAFEICGSGGLQLIEDKPAVQQCFEPGSEVLTYDSVAEIVELVQRATVDRGWADRIRSAGASRALSEHTYQHRIDTMWRNVGLTG